MFKKFLVIALALACVFAFVACGDDKLEETVAGVETASGNVAGLPEHDFGGY